jgi:hypothetical protein
MAVVEFRRKEPPEPRIWQCNCDCQAFWLYEDGSIQCQACDAFANTMKGQWSVVVAEADDPA